jgi:hypothetical protein
MRQPASVPSLMRVSLAYVAHRVNVYLRFGQPQHEAVLDRWRRVASFTPGAVCCRVKWLGNDYGTALWQLLVLQAPSAEDEFQRVGGVQPGARILLRADGEERVKAVLQAIDAIDAIEQLGIDPCVVATSYWSTLSNRLAARQALPAYTLDRHAAYLARGALS